MPDFVVNPYAWGKLRKPDPPTYFLLMEFKHFKDTNDLPDAVVFSKRLAEMHRKSQSPNGKFGFPVVTYDGAKTQVVDWDSSWASSFSKLLAGAYQHDVKAHGVWPELDEIFQKALLQLIPRLIGVMESEGRSIKPSLVHGDLWEGNVRLDCVTGDPWIFDCAALYGHHEYDLAIGCAKRHKLKNTGFFEEYFKENEASEPVAEKEDRNKLYQVKTNFMFSSCTERHARQE